MKIETIKILWHEKQGFDLERKNIGEQYIFLYFPTPVDFYLADGTLIKTENSFIILNKYSYQKLHISHNNFVHNFMHITGNLDYIMTISNLQYNTLYEIHNGDFITSIMHDLELEIINPDEYSLSLTEFNLKKLFLLLGRSVNTSNQHLINSKNKKLLISVRMYIQQTYFDKWTIESMASFANLSPSRFCELYTKFFKISPKKDLQNIRIQHAKNFLMSGKYTVKEISEMIGYENEYYFIRKFKQITGKTPGHYSKNN